MATRDIQVAQYWDKGEHYGAARIYYAQVLKDYPQTPFADAAKTRMAALEGKPNEPPSRLAFLTDWAKPKEKTSDEKGGGSTMTARKPRWPSKLRNRQQTVQQVMASRSRRKPVGKDRCVKVHLKRSHSAKDNRWLACVQKSAIGFLSLAR